MASALNTKINSYSLGRGIEFDAAWASPPPGRTGTNPLGTYGFNSGTKPVWDRQNGPSGGAGSWKFTRSSTIAENQYIRGTTVTATEASNMQDGTYSFGFWYKTENLPTGASQVQLFSATSINYGFTLNIYGSTSSYPGRIGFTTASGSVTPSTTDYLIVPNRWHYIAVIRKSDGTYSLYNNNVPCFENISLSSAASAITTWQWHNTSASTAWNTGSWWLSNFYVAEPTVIDRAAIAEIWAVGNAGFKNATLALPTQPINWWTADDGTSDVLLNYGTAGGSAYDQNFFNLTGTAGTNFNWITGEVKGGIEYTSSWGGYDQNPSWTPMPAGSGQMTINYWFKKSAPPASAQTWLYRYYNANDNIDSVNEAGIQTNGYINFKPNWSYSGGPYAQSEVTTQMNVCDGNWHMITITYETAALVGTMRMYVDGVLKDTKADWGNSSSGTASSFSFGAQSTSWDEFQTYGYRLTDAQILSLYQSEYPAASSYPLKYWNGSSWATPISMKQWNGSAWVTMVGKVYNGTSFVSIS